MSEPLVVAIDGPSGAGKSTVARGVADALDLPHVDTGALYRAATLAALRADVDVADPAACAEVARRARVERRDGRTYLDGEDVEDAIRGPDVTEAVSTFSAHGPVREAMIDAQRQAVAEAGGVVEGRDIGTIVLPDADVKIFLTATPEERARRRAAELGAEDVDAVADDLARRDAVDAGREVAPLVQADDAWEVDTTGLDIPESVDAVTALVRALHRRPASDLDDEEEAEVVPETDVVLEAEEAFAVEDVPGGSAIDEIPPGDLVDVEDDDQPPVHAAVRARGALPRIAVVGRPNVGKSTLVNRIIGHRAAIVEERAGVTRDRTEYLASWRGRPFIVIDTGGWEHAAEGLSARVVEQAERAIETADLVLFVVDTTVGALEDDELYARLLRRAERPTVLAANKVDSDKQMPYVHELYRLGLDDPWPVSAAHGRGVGDLLDAVLERLPEEGPEAPDEAGIPRVAVIGRPNVGKSSLFNRLVGEERSIVDAVPHTTRDAVDTLIELDGEPWLFVDTAGLRRRYRHGEETELYSVDRTRRALENAHLALFVVDGSEPLGEQDQRLAALVRDAGCGLVFVVNKWDEVDDDRGHDLEREIDRLLRFTAWAPRVNVSALSGRGVGRIVRWLEQVWDAHRRRVPTSELNAWLEDAVERQPHPPGKGRRPVRLKYVTQIRSGPPTFLLFTNAPVDDGYKRYLERELRDRYDLIGTPVVILDRPPDGERPRRRS